MQFNTPFPSTSTGINNSNSTNSNATPLMINPIGNISTSANNAAAGTAQLTNISEEVEYNPHLEKVRGFLGRTLRVTISDTRVFEGIFVCTDSHVNLILSMAQEFRQTNRRRVGLIMIPGKHIKKIEVKKHFSRFGTFT